MKISQRRTTTKKINMARSKWCQRLSGRGDFYKSNQSQKVVATASWSQLGPGIRCVCTILIRATTPTTKATKMCKQFVAANLIVMRAAASWRFLRKDHG